MYFETRLVNKIFKKFFASDLFELKIGCKKYIHNNHTDV